jgi:hypothetical protein
LGSKLHECELFSAATTPTVLTTIISATSEEMYRDDIKITLSLLEMEVEESDEQDQQHHEGEDIPVVMMMPAKLTDHVPLPSLASSLCSLSEGLREEEEDEDFPLLSDRITKVAFSTVKVRQYTITVGDHPCCNTGYALSLDWDYEALPEQSLEAYEAGHGQRRNLTELLTSYEERRSRLEECADCDAVKRLNRRLERQKCRNRRAVDSFFS